MAFDPMTGRSGALNVRGSGDVREVYLQIPAGGSLIVAESPAPRARPSTLTERQGSLSPFPDRGRCAL